MHQANSKDVLAAIRAENEKVGQQTMPKKDQAKPSGPLAGTNPFASRPVSHVVQERPRIEQPMKVKAAPQMTSHLPVVQEKTVPEIPEEKEDLLNQTQSKGLGILLQRIERLDHLRRGQLLAVLRELESGADLGAVDLAFLSSGPASKEVVAKQPAVGSSEPVRTFGSKNLKEVKIVVLSTWSSPHICGLAQLELFDAEAAQIKIDPVNIFQRN
jgi:hypothetical protein